MPCALAHPTTQVFLRHFKTLIFQPEYTPLAAAQLKSGLLGWNRKLWQDGERTEPSVK